MHIFAFNSPSCAFLRLCLSYYLHLAQSHLYFHYYRAVVDSVITINGTGLGSEACQNVVMFGDTNCTVLSQSDTWLTCEVSNQTDILLTEIEM